MARLARYGNVQPTEFAALLYAEAVALDNALYDLRVDEAELQAEIAKLSRGGL